MISKRVFDLAIGIPATIALLPLMLVIGLLVLATSGWPVLIVQTRVGASERPIRVLKFRTMRRGVPVVAKSALTPIPAMYTRLGPFLRASSLDELPQLLNVLGGDMSLIGPRPALPTQHDLLELRRRAAVIGDKPGITGLAQVVGRESLSLPTKVRCEVLYHRRRSLALDARILAWTVRALLSRRGAY